MMKLVFFVIILNLLLCSCDKFKHNNRESKIFSEEVLKHKLASIVDSIEICQKQKINNRDILFINMIFYNRNDSNFLQINCDLGPTLFINNYNGFLGFKNYKGNYLIMSSSCQDTIFKNLINTTALNNDTVEYEKINSDKYLSDGLTYIFYIDNDSEILPNNQAAESIFKKD